MALVKVMYQGQMISELELVSGHEYIAGRGAQANIVLNQERAISRQHLKFAEENGIWRVTLLSRIGSLITNGQSVDSIALDNDLHFSVPPYEFIFEFAAKAAAAEDSPTDSPSDDGEPQESQSQSQNEMSEGETPARGVTASYTTKEGDTSPGNLDATRVGASALMAFMKITNSSNGNEETLKLEGHVWTVGRHPSSEIYINDSSISRKHFELSKTTQGYFVTDFDSSNGTTVNGERIEPHKAFAVRSGDVITIRNIQIVFEIRNTQFDKLIQNLPALADSADMGEEEYQEGTANIQMREATALMALPGQIGSEPEMSGPGVIRMPPPKGIKRLFQDKRITIALAILLLGMAYVFSQPSEKPAPVAQGQEELGSKKEVTAQQMSVVKEKYELAKKNYYERGNYTFCRDLLYEAHQIVPFYEDSKNLLALCEQSIELQLIRAEREQKEKKKLEAENKIRSTVENCKSLMTPTTTTATLQECLAPAFELDPQNAEGMSLISQVETRDAELKAKADEAKNASARAAVGREHYQRAVRLENAGKVKAALNEYQSFVAKSYPGMSTEVSNARRSIASIERAQQQKIAGKLAACKSLASSSYKQAIQACETVLTEDPQNSTAKELRDSAKSKLQKELRAAYEDSRLEESMGNVEGAKQKWQKIMVDSYPGEEFFEKAKGKIKKYEGG